MEKFQKYLLLLLVTTISLSLTSCGGDDENEYEQQQPCFSINDAQLSGSGGSLDCTIYNCNPYTSVQANVGWITVQMSDLNSGRCYISVTKNTTSFEREGVVKLFYKGQVVDYLYVKQGAGTAIPEPGGDYPGDQEFGAPTGLSLSKSGNMVTLTWNKVPKAIRYLVYYSDPTGFDSGNYVFKDWASSTTFTMKCSIAGNWAFLVYAYDGSKYSDYSNIVSTYISESDINGGGGGGNTQKPSAPTGVSVSNEGNSYIPDVRVRWNAVSNATYYYIYRSSSANGSYSKIGEMPHPNTSYSDSGAPTNGKSAYYKVKAVNSAGESNFSAYAKYTAPTYDDAFAPAYTYGSCTVSGRNMTLRWTNSTGYGYGKATSVVLRVWNPYAEEWQDTNLSATATSTTFNFSTKIDSGGYVKAGIVVRNANGSFTAGAKIYDTKSKKWLN